MQDKSETVTLRIKKIYFDKILEGAKRIEYRHYREYYLSIFSSKKKISKLRLHYQSGKMLEIGVQSIKVRPTPEHLFNSPLKFGRIIFEIKLKGKAKIIKK